MFIPLTLLRDTAIDFSGCITHWSQHNKVWKHTAPSNILFVQGWGEGCGRRSGMQPNMTNIITSIVCSGVSVFPALWAVSHRATSGRGQFLCVQEVPTQAKWPRVCRQDRQPQVNEQDAVMLGSIILLSLTFLYLIAVFSDGLPEIILSTAVYFFFVC